MFSEMLALDQVGIRPRDLQEASDMQKPPKPAQVAWRQNEASQLSWLDWDPQGLSWRCSTTVYHRVFWSPATSPIELRGRDFQVQKDLSSQRCGPT